MRWADYQGASNCTGTAAQGARHLLAWLLESYPGSRSLGIYNCRTVRGGSTTSLHGEGRAVDLDPDRTRGANGHAVGRSLVARLGEHGQRLGVQAVIYNREIWSQRSPEGRYYGGVHPHNDHLHIELTRAAGSNLTLATLRAVLGGPEEDDVYVVRMDDEGPRVERAQTVLRAAGKAAGFGDLLPEYGADGDYGDETAGAVNRIAKAAGLPAAGGVGMDVLVLDWCRMTLERRAGGGVSESEVIARIEGHASDENAHHGHRAVD